MKWAKKNECDWNEDTCIRAAGGSYFKVLKWVKKNECKWNKETWAYAAIKMDNLEVLKWQRDEKCPWNENTCARVAECSNLEMLK